MKSLKIGQLFGIPIFLHWSWFIAFVYFSYILLGDLGVTLAAEAPSKQVGLGVAAATTCLIFGSIVLHELGHSLVAQRYKLPVRSITLFIFGGVALLEHEAKNAKQEFLIASAGPAASAVLGAVAFGILALLTDYPLLAWVARWLMHVNFVVAVFNLLPGFPLDGGRILRALLWWRTGSLERATQSAGRSGQLIAFFLIGMGALSGLASGDWLSGGIVLILIGWYLLLVSNASMRQTQISYSLRDLRARDLVAPQMLRVDGDSSVHRLVELLVQNGKRWALIETEGHIVGLATLSDSRRIPAEAWPEIAASRAATPLNELVTAGLDEPAHQLLSTMLNSGVSQIPILDQTRIIGVVNFSDLLRLSSKVPTG